MDNNFICSISTSTITQACYKNEDIALCAPYSACSYAITHNMKSFESGESIIATDASSSYNYAVIVLKNRFTLREQTIAKYSYLAYS